jgi:hypothetical protein
MQGPDESQLETTEKRPAGEKKTRHTVDGFGWVPKLPSPETKTGR